MTATFVNFCRLNVHTSRRQNFHTLISDINCCLHRNGFTRMSTPRSSEGSNQVVGHTHRPHLHLTRPQARGHIQGYCYRHLTNVCSTKHLYHTPNNSNLFATLRYDKAFYAPACAPQVLTGGVAVRGYRSRRSAVQNSWEGEPLEDEDAGAAPGYSGPTPAEQEDRAWMLRMAIENSFLSWTRNSYIMTVAGVTVYCQGSVPFAQEAGVVLLLAAGVKLLTGTSLYVYSLAKRCRRMAMSGVSAAALGVLSMVHVFLWVGALMVYLGYVEELDDPILIQELEEELKEHAKRHHHRLSDSSKRFKD